MPSQSRIAKRNSQGSTFGWLILLNPESSAGEDKNTFFQNPCFNNPTDSEDTRHRNNHFALVSLIPATIDLVSGHKEVHLLCGETRKCDLFITLVNGMVGRPRFTSLLE